MRKVEGDFVQFGEVDIADIKINTKSRDDIPKILLGLQYIYITKKVREAVFDILEKIVPEKIDKNNGRPGMHLWQIFVLGVLRLNLNCDYDRLAELGNKHETIRQMLGHGILDKDFEYNYQRLRDNIAMFTPEILEEINTLVVGAGHNLVKQNGEKIRGKCDSFVLETDVHFPTDINLLFDSIRKIVCIIAFLADEFGLSGWRKFKNNIRHVKRLHRRTQKLKKSTSKNETKKAQREQLIIDAHQEYIDLVRSYILKAVETKKNIKTENTLFSNKIKDFNHFLYCANLLTDQIERRVINGETIPQDEKIYSVFESHTEWINKGKAGVPVELGLRVSVVEDQFGFILNHKVMEKITDDKIAVSIVTKTKQLFPDFSVCSFDKGYHSPSNQLELSKLLDKVVLPRKGKLSVQAKEIETEEEFKTLRRKHSAVESGINALEVHGLDRCPDHGIDGFKRYVSLAVVARNIQQIGEIIRRRQEKQSKRAA